MMNLDKKTIVKEVLGTLLILLVAGMLVTKCAKNSREKLEENSAIPVQQSQAELQGAPISVSPIVYEDDDIQVTLLCIRGLEYYKVKTFGSYVRVEMMPTDADRMGYQKCIDQEK